MITAYFWEMSKLADTNTYTDPGARARTHTHTHDCTCRLVCQYVCNERMYILISFTNFNAQFLYSLTICMLHYNPRRVSSINMPIFRRTTSGIVTLCTAVYRE